MNLNVRLIGAGGGINSSGPTHSGLEDAGTVRGLPMLPLLVRQIRQ